MNSLRGPHGPMDAGPSSQARNDDESSLSRSLPLNAIEELEKACFAGPWTPLQIRDEVRRDDSACIILDAQGNVQEFSDSEIAPGGIGGYCLVRIPPDPDPAEILRIAVDPGKRRRGAGRLLLNKAESVVRARRPSSDAFRILLEVSETNQAALDLYLTAGYIEINRRRNYYGDGTAALILEKRSEPEPGHGK